MILDLFDLPFDFIQRPSAWRKLSGPAAASAAFVSLLVGSFAAIAATYFFYSEGTTARVVAIVFFGIAILIVSQAIVGLISFFRA